jgi:hypothetical protein
MRWSGGLLCRLRRDILIVLVDKDRQNILAQFVREPPTVRNRFVNGNWIIIFSFANVLAAREGDSRDVGADKIPPSILAAAAAVAAG